jgi:4-amino-4-deoxy-L-arabinose transferase-like glycosyltransferase
MARIDGIGWAGRLAASEQEHADRSAYAVPIALVVLALLHGLLYLAVVPPWQHYDEPTHFEYARLIALWGRQPGVNEIDLATNREIADSMYRFRFWRPGVRPPLFGAEPPPIGFNEKVHPPLYYTIAAVPVRWLRYSAIETQLYAARMVAVLLYALVVACAWRIAAILAPDRRVMHIAAPLVLILVPAFADQMSAVNNDSLVNFSTAALLLGCVLLIRDGLRPLPLILAGLSLAVAVATKRTAVVGVVPFALALFWSLRWRPISWWAWVAALVVLSVLVGYGSFEYGPHGWSARPWLADLDRQYLRLGLNQVGAGSPRWYAYPLLFDILFTSFWARFGWGAVAIGWWADWALRAVVLAGIAGLIVAGIWSGDASASWRRRVVWLFAATIVVAWLAAVVRFEAEQGPYVPRGRYIHMALLPTIWLLMLGVKRLAPRRWRAQSLFTLTLLFALLDTAAWAGALSGLYYR